MHHSPLFIVTLIVLDGWFVATMCRVLTMRSKRVYGLATLSTMAALAISAELGVPVSVRAITLGAPHAIILPIVCSTDPPDKRLTRTILVNLMILGIEFLCSSLIRTLPSSVTGFQGQAGAFDVTEIYIYSAPLIIPFLELFAAIVNRTDRGSQQADIGIGITVACLIAYVPFCTFALALYASHPDDLTVAGIGLLCTLLSIAFCLITLWVARREAQIAHDQTERSARFRQERHMLAEIDSLVKRSMQMRKLRHDLANHIFVVEELSRRGNVPEAQRYLSGLRQQTQAIMESSEQPHG